MASKIVKIKKNPKLDWAVGLWGGAPVPTKQEKYKPMVGYQGVLQENGVEKVLEELYIRNPDKNIVAEFEARLSGFLKENLGEGQPYPMPLRVEVILAVTINKKRFFEVDVDNLAKTILDAMKGLVFEDDSQVINLLVMKELHPWDSNGLSIGVNLIEDPEKSWFGPIKLFYMEEEE